MSVIEHWFCPGCGEIDGPRAGMTCHGPQMTGGCASVGNKVVEISHDAALRLAGAVRARELAQALVDLADENTNIKGAHEVAAEIVKLLTPAAGGQ